MTDIACLARMHIRFLTACAVVLTGCTSTTTDPAPDVPPGARLVASALPRDTTPSVTAEARTALSRGNAELALSLYRLTAADSEAANFVVAPYDVSVTWAMAYAGARGETKTQMAEALHFALDDAELHAAFDEVDLALRSRAGAGLELELVNGVWGQDGFDLAPAFLDVLAESYGSGVFALDFQADPEAARVIINEWVAARTRGRVAELVPRGSIDSLSRLVLSNAVYFLGAWNAPFDPAATTTRDFHLADGTVVQQPTMRQTTTLRYGETSDWQAVELPYVGGALSMVALRPTGASLAPLEATLDASRIEEVLASLDTRMTTIEMPKFTVQGAVDLKDAFQRVGMTDAFDPALADLSGIDGKRDLFVQAAHHRAFLDVDEEGTEGAAASAIVVGTRSSAPPAEISLDQPFLFLVRDIETGAIMFIGRVVDPTE